MNKAEGTMNNETKEGEIKAGRDRRVERDSEVVKMQKEQIQSIAFLHFVPRSSDAIFQKPWILDFT